jgi:hypothetical protein
MIEAGSHEQIKESILGNLTFRPDLPLLKRVRKCFEDQEFKVQAVTVKNYKCGGRNSTLYEWPVVVVTFTSKRTVQGAMAKTLRAIRAARLSMYQFNDFGKKPDGMYSYAVELRENE